MRKQGNFNRCIQKCFICCFNWCIQNLRAGREKSRCGVNLASPGSEYLSHGCTTLRKLIYLYHSPRRHMIYKRGNWGLGDLTFSKIHNHTLNLSPHSEAGVGKLETRQSRQRVTVAVALEFTFPPSCVYHSLIAANWWFLGLPLKTAAAQQQCKEEHSFI